MPRDSQPLDVHVSIVPDTPRMPAWDALWRRLLSRPPEADLPPLAGAIAEALDQAEPASPPLVEPTRGFVNRGQGSEATG